MGEFIYIIISLKFFIFTMGLYFQQIQTYFNYISLKEWWDQSGDLVINY